MKSDIHTIKPLVPQLSVTALTFARHAGKVVRIQGAIHRTRALGGVTFVIVRDREDLIQAVLNRADTKVDEGDLNEGNQVIIEGTVHEDKRAPNGAEVRIKTLTVVGRVKEEAPVVLSHPTLDVHLETNLSYRPVTLRHPTERAIFRLQAAIAQQFRAFLSIQGFTEIFTPKIVAAGAEGGANIFSVPYFKQKAYLTQSPQLYKQMMVGVFERVFEVGHVYRAEQHNTSRHLNEYISLDFEMGFIDSMEDMMGVEVAYLKSLMEVLKKEHSRELELLSTKLPVVTEIPAVKLHEGIALIRDHFGYKSPSEHDLDQKGEQLLCEYAQREYGSEFIFVTHYPRPKRPFYAMDDPENPALTLSFDLLLRGLEVTTGGQRIHDYAAQVKKMKEWKLNPKNFEHYLMAHRNGLPPHGGLAIGLERLVTRLLGLPNVRQGTLFPRDIDRLTP